MDRLKLTLSIALALVTNLFANAQNNNPIAETKRITETMQEKIFLHLNTTTFVTGETLYFKIYCMNPVNNSTSLISKIGYVELIDSNKQVVSKSKIYLEKGIGEGNYFIPTTLSTGSYKLIAYTKWMLNSSSSNFEVIDLTIINPYKPKQVADLSGNNTISNTTNNSSIAKNESSITKNITIQKDKKTYSNREKVNLNIIPLSGHLEKGNYSISIRKLVTLPIKRQRNAIAFKENNTITNSKNSITNIDIIPELRGELITGSISSRKKELGISNKIVILSIPGKSFAVKSAKTNSSGKFIFILDKNPNNSNCIVQVMDDNRNDYSIQLDELAKVETTSLNFQSDLNLTINDSVAIQEQSIANQIENGYYDIKKDSLLTEVKTESFFNTFQKEYVLDDYTRFPTFKETIIEVVTELYFRKNNEDYLLYVRNDKKDLTIYGPPLVLVDGIVIQNVNELFNYNMANVSKISLINEGYVYGPGLFGGLVSIETKNNDYQTKATGDFIKKTDIQRPLSETKFFVPDYTDLSKNQRIPDYRYQLLWLPQLTLASNENPISFYTSDVTGTFEITLEGFTDQGIPVSLKDTFEVQ
ncbi:hypothetical protein [Flavobacterium sp. A45]|uniref:hypothetical protein n=1 Tax=Flavobacterium sp. A45 TaxID=1945862 RepID=UPI0009855322|nr:hypothetical protein [Flavobacterium sp. A45]OOG76578.1 hypothetical protein B0E44_03690 [Flavobacterium sp. A45]